MTEPANPVRGGGSPGAPTEPGIGMEQGRILITGTGRAGSTFLVVLLTHLGLDTGFTLESVGVEGGTPSNPKFFPAARAGLEWDIRAKDAPRVVKSPHFCDHADEVLASGIRIEHAIIPIRQFEAAAASRIHVHQEAVSRGEVNAVPGGLWGTGSADRQAAVLRHKFTNLIEALVRHDVPITFLWYPKLVQDPDYLFGKLRFLLPRTEIARFRPVHSMVARPDWVHQLGPSDR